MKKIQWTELLIFIIGTELVGALSGLLSGNFSSFYSELVKPPLSPPGILFPIVWAILYAIMGISAYMIYTSDAGDMKKRNALSLYAAQLFFNFLWSIVFFRFEQPAAALGVLLLLAILIVLMILAFRKIRPLAGYLNIPYLLWVLFAMYLNIGFVLLN
ncbi:MAG: tryptophan-rich sensory protein [Oscillospiraceae bacterium]|nr:tryptophan-rich sensory protein [Oscillospiraceae bacterium]